MEHIEEIQILIAKAQDEALKYDYDTYSFLNFVRFWISLPTGKEKDAAHLALFKALEPSIISSGDTVGIYSKS